jgi:spore germination protein KA
VLIATLLPGSYIAITNFHQEMIPTELLIAIAIARENVPFATIVEVLLMETSFELIREAGIRVPGIIGNTIGIIGALIIGQAAVQANLVSPVLIIIVAVTGLGNFAIPDFSLAFGLRIVRILFIFAGAFLGFYGILLLFVSLLVLLVDMKSFGVPYLSKMTPKTRKSFNSIIRYPVWKQELRPDSINPLDVRRQPEISRQWAKEDPETGYDREDSDE